MRPRTQRAGGHKVIRALRCRRGDRHMRPRAQRGGGHKVIRALRCRRCLAPHKTKRRCCRRRCQRAWVGARGQFRTGRAPRHAGRQALLLGFHQPRVAGCQQLCAPHAVRALLRRVGNIRQPLPGQQHVGVAARVLAQAIARTRNIARLRARNQFIDIAPVRQHAVSLTDRAQVRQPSPAHSMRPQKSAFHPVSGYNAAHYLRSACRNRCSPVRIAAAHTAPTTHA